MAGARAAGVRAVLVDRGGRGAAGSRGRALARRGPLPTLRPMDAAPSNASRRDPPELPEGAAPRWPAVVRRGGLPRGDQRRRWSWSASPPCSSRARRRQRGRRDLHDRRDAHPERDLRRHGGLLRVVHAQAQGLALRAAPDAASGRPWAGPRSGWSPSTCSAAIYSVVVQPDAEQTVAEDLGSDQGTFGLIAAGFMIVCVAPVGRGVLLPRLLLPGAALALRAAGAGGDRRRCCSALIHFDFSGADALLILPPLALLGFIFCLVYEKTGSLFPVIAMHSINNSIAYGAQARRLGGVGGARAADDARLRARAADLGAGPGAPASHGAASRLLPAIVSPANDRSSGPCDSARPRSRPPRRPRRRRPRRPSPAPPVPAPAPARPARPRSASTAGSATKKARYFAPGQTVVAARPRAAVRGRPGGHAPGGAQGQGRASASAARSGAGGRFTFRFQVGNPGRLRLRRQARGHARSRRPSGARDRTIQVVSWQRRRGLARHARAAAPARARVARTSPPRSPATTTRPPRAP